MTLEVLTPDKTVFQGPVTSVTVPGSVGSFEILKDHAPIISTLEDGKIIIRGGSKPEEILFITGGVVEVLNNKIIVLAEGVGETI
jgi:F-type H+-transporting ATPase subunit epsilon